MNDPREPGGEEKRLAPRGDRTPDAAGRQARSLPGLIHQRMLRAARNSTRTTAQILNFLIGTSAGFILAALVVFLGAPFISKFTAPVISLVVICFVALGGFLCVRRNPLGLAEHLTTDAWKRLERAQDIYDLQDEKLGELARELKALGIPDEQIAAELKTRRIALYDGIANVAASLMPGDGPPAAFAAGTIAPPPEPVDEHESAAPGPDGARANGVEIVRGVAALGQDSTFGPDTRE